MKFNKFCAAIKSIFPKMFCVYGYVKKASSFFSSLNVKMFLHIIEKWLFLLIMPSFDIAAMCDSTIISIFFYHINVVMWRVKSITNKKKIWIKGWWLLRLDFSTCSIRCIVYLLHAHIYTFSVLKDYHSDIEILLCSSCFPVSHRKYKIVFFLVGEIETNSCEIPLFDFMHENSSF